MAARRQLERSYGRVSGKSAAMQLANRQRSLESAHLVGSLNLGTNTPVPARTTLTLGWEGRAYPFLSDPGDCSTITLYLHNIRAHLSAIDILLRQKYGIMLRGGRGGRESLALRPPVGGMIHQYREKDGTLYVQHPHTVSWRSVFPAHEPPRGIDAKTTAEAANLCSLLGPSVIGMDETIFYHVLNPQDFNACLRDYGHFGELPGPIRVYPVPFLTDRAKRKEGIQWEQHRGPLTRSVLVRKEKSMGWVALAQQVADQPSPRLLIESPVPLEIPETLQLTGMIFIGVPTQYYERPQHIVASGSMGEGASSAPPSNPVRAGGVSPGEAEQEAKQETLEEVADDLPDYDMLEEVEATVATTKIEPTAFFEALTYGPTPAEAAGMPSSSSHRPAVPRPVRPKQAPLR